jgi:hypothetical protein
MEDPIYHITEFEIVAPYTWRIKFDDNTEQTINFKPLYWPEIHEDFIKHVQNWELA